MKTETIQPLNFSTVQRIKAAAFTLAEILIVIGIIGVVAALTLPNLNHTIGDKEKVTKVKKLYSSLTDAVDRAQVIYGDVDTWGKGLASAAEKNERFAKRVTEFLKVSKDCGFDEGCFSDTQLLMIDGKPFSNSGYLSELQDCEYYMVKLSDGVSIAFSYAGCGNYIDILARIKTDIDGPNKGKNQYGNDIFDFSILLDDTEETIRAHSKQILNQLYPSALDGNYAPSTNATSWVIENDNLDYLKCDDELDWETKTSCK